MATKQKMTVCVECVNVAQMTKLTLQFVREIIYKSQN